MLRFLSAVFFLSGAAALLFETLWFRQAGLALGNSVWAASLVTASFMAGLAAGAWAAGWKRVRLPRPLQAYAALELTVGVLGVAVVIAFPRMWGVIAALSGPLAGHPAALNAFRLTVAFAVLAVPACALGATLPLLLEALAPGGAFGAALGRLYGWNTLGAVAGALAGEFLLIERLGVRGTALAAGGLDLIAAAAVLALIRRAPITPHVVAAAQAEAQAPGHRGVPLLAAAALAGAALLALETIWLRFLLLFVCGTSRAFALLLAVVLLGIGAGGLAAAASLRMRPSAVRAAPAVALLAGVSTAASYALFPLGAALARPCGFRIALVALPLALPTSVASGLLFTFVGAALREPRFSDRGTAGALTVANTLGALAGGLLGGLVLLPLFGVEGAVFAIATGYAIVALFLYLGMHRSRPGNLGTLLAAIVLVTAVVFFPFGRMRASIVPAVVRPWVHENSRLLAYREGITETSAYLCDDLWGRPVAYRLLTNSFSMAGTGYNIDRYTRLFAYWPVALRPRPRSGLLISYGVGSTATALVGVPSFETIDVVDISRDVLDLALRVFPPEGHPLRDPRVRIHIEDGRQFLLLGSGGFDLITAEPPPPRHAGIVNLYSREYFALLRRRLNPRGTVTYWLPVHSLKWTEALSITRGFCDVFPDCTLWNGYGFDWMLAGTRDLEGAPTEEEFGAQWRDPERARELKALGYDSPAQIGSTFLADGEFLRALARDAPPLVDDWPYRLDPGAPSVIDPAFYRLAGPTVARDRFAASPWIRRMFPPAVRQATLLAFDTQALVDGITMGELSQPGGLSFRTRAAAILSRPPRRFTTLWLLGFNEAAVEAARAAAARRTSDPLVDEILAADALADLRPDEAAERWQRALRARNGPTRDVLWWALARCAAGRPPGRQEWLEVGSSVAPEDRDDLPWIAACGHG
jgi:spermidine synthase